MLLPIKIKFYPKIVGEVTAAVEICLPGFALILQKIFTVKPKMKTMTIALQM